MWLDDLARRDLAADPVRCKRMRLPKTTPCIQLQLKCHMAATQAARNGRKLAEKGRRREALKALAEAEQWERLYRKYGGKGPIMGLE